jgi:MFS superfamily sulfate permease-like transporter
MSAVFHGFLLLISALLIPGLLNRTPLACLAAILLVIGYRLARPAIFRAMWKQGLPQFVPFLVTVLAIVFTDLLVGVLIGLTVGIFFVMRGNNHEAVIMVNQDRYYMIRFNKDATFVNKPAFKTFLQQIPDHAYLIIDATKAIYIDNDIFEVAAEFRQQAFFRNITVEFKNFFRDGKKLEDYTLSSAH